MEMNATDKFYLSVDGIPETFKSCNGHHQLRITRPVMQNITHSPMHQHRSSSSSKVSNISKEKRGVACRSSSTGSRHSSSDRHLTRSVDLLELGLTKPKNCQRIVVLGAPKVGKTNILQRFLGRDFEERYEPTAEDFHRKLYHIGGEAYQVDLLDAARERNFPAKRRLSILTGDIFLLVFSVDNKESFKEVCELRDDIRAAKTKLMKLKDTSRVPIVICGNKVDLGAQRVVSRLEAREILGEDAAFFETSAKECTGLEGMFRALAALSGLPDQTSPLQHQTISLLAYQALCTGQRGRRGSRTPGLGAPCAAVDPLARRPSFTSDLQMVLGSSTKHKSEKCQIQ
uniref:RASD family member 2a n=1 Tax=Myripristis murdjan TaxID=586833 RepID=A0A667WL86_9TELE